MDARAAFALLGVPPQASTATIREAYRDLIKVWHPDRFAGDARLQAKATERTRDLNQAYEVATAYAAAGGGPLPDTQAPQAQPRAASAEAPTATAAYEAPETPLRRVRLSLDAIGQAIFWAACLGLIAFIATAPEGFFAREKGRGVRAPREGRAEARIYTPLPQAEHGEADLLSRIRGTWVVVESGDDAWLPSGTQIDLRGDALACRGPYLCDAAVKPIGAARLAIRDSAGDTRHVDVSFASTTSMLWVMRRPGARPLRIVLEAQGGPTAGPAPTD
jgi:hypothetical protein